MHNEVLKNEHARVSRIATDKREQVKKLMGWDSDGPFYSRVNGFTECTEAEKMVFSQVYGLPVEQLFPEKRKRK
jgi:hypothetical protein